MTRTDISSADSEWLGNLPAQFRESMESRVSEFPNRDTYPAYADLLAGADGTIRVQHYPAPEPNERRRTVFGINGRSQREVRSAHLIRILDAGDDYVLARLTDDLGLERLLLFDLPPLR